MRNKKKLLQGSQLAPSRLHKRRSSVTSDNSTMSCNLFGQKKNAIITYSRSKPIQIVNKEHFLTPDTPQVFTPPDQEFSSGDGPDKILAENKGNPKQSLRKSVFLPHGGSYNSTGTPSSMETSNSDKSKPLSAKPSLALRNISNIPIDKTLSRTPCTPVASLAMNSVSRMRAASVLSDGSHTLVHTPLTPKKRPKIREQKKKLKAKSKALLLDKEINKPSATKEKRKEDSKVGGSRDPKVTSSLHDVTSYKVKTVTTSLHDVTSYNVKTVTSSLHDVTSYNVKTMSTCTIGSSSGGRSHQGLTLTAQSMSLVSTGSMRVGSDREGRGSNEVSNASKCPENSTLIEGEIVEEGDMATGVKRRRVDKTLRDEDQIQRADSQTGEGASVLKDNNKNDVYHKQEEVDVKNAVSKPSMQEHEVEKERKRALSTGSEVASPFDVEKFTPDEDGGVKCRKTSKNVKSKKSSMKVHEVEKECKRDVAECAADEDKGLKRRKANKNVKRKKSSRKEQDVEKECKRDVSTAKLTSPFAMAKSMPAKDEGTLIERRTDQSTTEKCTDQDTLVSSVPPRNSTFNDDDRGLELEAVFPGDVSVIASNTSASNDAGDTQNKPEEQVGRVPRGIPVVKKSRRLSTLTECGTSSSSDSQPQGGVSKTQVHDSSVSDLRAGSERGPKTSTPIETARGVEKPDFLLSSVETIYQDQDTQDIKTSTPVDPDKVVAIDKQFQVDFSPITADSPKDPRANNEVSHLPKAIRPSHKHSRESLLQTSKCIEDVSKEEHVADDVTPDLPIPNKSQRCSSSKRRLEYASTETEIEDCFLAGMPLGKRRLCKMWVRRNVGLDDDPDTVPIDILAVF